MIGGIAPRLDGLSRFAADHRDAGPRLVAEPGAGHRTAFARDRDRVLHSLAFRRLASKTQVMLPAEGDQHRTRLTHTLEVAQVARSLARALGLDEDLTEALALSHDFGHGPFGHTGEDALDRVLTPWGGFDHNTQSLRIVVDLEQRYLDFDGLNLTLTTLEGLAKRKGPTDRPEPLLAGYAARLGLDLTTQPSAEAQVAAIADDIAYNAHDLEDGLRAGLIEPGDARAVPVIGRLLGDLERGRGLLDPARVPFALARGLIDCFVTDALAESQRRLAAAAPADVGAVRRLSDPVIALSAQAEAEEREIKDFLFARLYRHPTLVAVRSRAADLVAAVAQRYLDRPELLPPPWTERAAGQGGAATPRAVADYVASLTDRQAAADYRRLFDARVDFV